MASCTPTRSGCHGTIADRTCSPERAALAILQHLSRWAVPKIVTPNDDRCDRDDDDDDDHEANDDADHDHDHDHDRDADDDGDDRDGDENCRSQW